MPDHGSKKYKVRRDSQRVGEARHRGLPVARAVNDHQVLDAAGDVEVAVVIIVRIERAVDRRTRQLADTGDNGAVNGHRAVRPQIGDGILEQDALDQKTAFLERRGPVVEKVLHGLRLYHPGVTILRRQSP